MRRRKGSVFSSSSKSVRKHTLAEALRSQWLQLGSDHSSPVRSNKQSLSPTPKQGLLDLRPQSYCLKRKAVKHRKIVANVIPFVDPRRSVYRLDEGVERLHSNSECKIHPASSQKRLTVIQIELESNDPPPRRTYSRALSRLKPQMPHYPFHLEPSSKKHATVETTTEDLGLPQSSAPPVSLAHFKPDDLGDPSSHSMTRRRINQRFSYRRLVT